MLKLGYRYPNSQVLRSLALILSILINQIRTNATLSLYTASPFLVLLLADRSQSVPVTSLFPSAASIYNADRGRYLQPFTMSVVKDDPANQGEFRTTPSNMGRLLSVLAVTT